MHESPLLLRYYSCYLFWILQTGKVYSPHLIRQYVNRYCHYKYKQSFIRYCPEATYLSSRLHSMKKFFFLRIHRNVQVLIMASMLIEMNYHILWNSVGKLATWFSLLRQHKIIFELNSYEIAESLDGILIVLLWNSDCRIFHISISNFNLIFPICPMSYMSSRRGLVCSVSAY